MTEKKEIGGYFDQILFENYLALENSPIFQKMIGNTIEQHLPDLKNKKAYLVITSGGTKLNSNEDFLTPWLKFILNFFGIEKIEVISADQMALDYEKSINDAEKQINDLVI